MIFETELEKCFLGNLFFWFRFRYWSCIVNWNSLLKSFGCYLAGMDDDKSSTPSDFDIEAFRQNSQGSFWAAFKNEFTLKRLGFNFNRTDVFTTGQWHLPRLVFVVYRLIVAAYAVSITFMSILKFNHNKWIYPWPVWLTNWSYFMLACYLLCSAVVAVISYFDRPSVAASEPLFRRALPFYIKLNWFLFVVASSAAILVSIVYFSAIFPRRKLTYLSEEDVHLHLMNSVLVILELAVSAIPVRILHFVYVMAYGAIYVAFSIIYWTFDHSRVLYPGILDWNRPLTSVAVILALSVVGFPILQCLLFAAYRLRLYVYNRIYHSNV